MSDMRDGVGIWGRRGQLVECKDGGSFLRNYRAIRGYGEIYDSHDLNL